MADEYRYDRGPDGVIHRFPKDAKDEEVAAALDRYMAEAKVANEGFVSRAKEGIKGAISGVGDLAKAAASGIPGVSEAFPSTAEAADRVQGGLVDIGKEAAHGHLLKAGLRVVGANPDHIYDDYMGGNARALAGDLLIPAIGALGPKYIPRATRALARSAGTIGEMAAIKTPVGRIEMPVVAPVASKIKDWGYAPLRPDPTPVTMSGMPNRASAPMSTGPMTATVADRMVPPAPSLSGTPRGANIPMSAGPMSAMVEDRLTAPTPSGSGVPKGPQGQAPIEGDPASALWTRPRPTSAPTWEDMARAAAVKPVKAKPIKSPNPKLYTDQNWKEITQAHPELLTPEGEAPASAPSTPTEPSLVSEPPTEATPEPGSPPSKSKAVKYNGDTLNDLEVKINTMRQVLDANPNATEAEVAAAVDKAVPAGRGRRTALHISDHYANRPNTPPLGEEEGQ